MTQSVPVSAPTGRIAPVIALLILSGITLDIQYGALSPLVGVIAAESNLTSPQVGWVLNAMLLGSAVSVGLTARMGDIYGHRKVLMALTVVAFAGSVLAILTTGFWPLVIGRFLIGLAVAIPLSWGLLRPRATAGTIRRVSLILSTAMSIFTPVALVVGGTIVELGLPWENFFFVSAALYVVLFILAAVSPETPARARATVKLDWFGAIGLGIWVAALLIAISEGPARGWTSPLVIGCFALSIVMLATWITQQRRTTAPIVSFQNMDVRQTLIGYSCILLLAFVGQGIFIALPALLQTPTSSGFGLGLSTLNSTYVLLGMIPGAMLSFLWTRWGLLRLGPRAVLLLSGTAAVGVYLGLAFAHGQVWLNFLWVFLYALTVLSCLTTGYTLVASAGRQDNMAMTVGLQNIIQFVATTIPVAIVLNVMTPGADGIIPEPAFVGIYVASAVIIVLFLILWAALAPRGISDRHAVDQQIDPTVVPIATH